MNISYKRNSNSNFMIIQCEHVERYELKMICKNKIKGLLSANTATFNGNCEIYYDISSRQPISRIYLKKEMEAEDIRMLLLSIKILMEEVVRYLLDITDVLFAPEFCYCNLEDNRPEWVFYPGNETNGLNEMAEFIIDRVDHSDSKAVDAAYKFFKLVKSDLLSVAEIENILERITLLENPLGEGNQPDNLMPKAMTDILAAPPVYKSDEKKSGFGIKSKILQLFGTIASADKKQQKVERVYNPKVQWETYGLEAPEVFAGETVVMGLQNHQEGHRLRNAKTAGDFIVLDKLPCVFGKLDTCADVVLNDNSVSRVHAQIFEDKGELYLQDLNSTNGSYVNSLAVENNEIVQLKRGDEIAFGNARYIYE